MQKRQWTKEDLQALMWYRGCTKKEALEEMRRLDPERMELINDCYKATCKKSFWID